MYQQNATPYQRWQWSVDNAIRNHSPSIPLGDDPLHFPQLTPAQQSAWLQSVRNAVESRHTYRILTPGEWLHRQQQQARAVDPWALATQHREAAASTPEAEQAG